MSGRRTAFLDRDGVINEDRGYVHRPEDFALLPDVVHALRRLAGAGYALVVVTNQSGIGRGLFTAAAFESLTAHMRTLLAADGVMLDAVLHCPHAPGAAGCDCRKPAPGMILSAAQELGLDLRQSFLAGDKVSDVAAGRAAGVDRCFLIGAGPVGQADAVFPSLAACARFVTTLG